MPRRKSSTGIPFTATRISRLKSTAPGERVVHHDDKRDGLLRIVCTETGCRFMYNGKSRVTMSPVSETQVDEAWRQADDWHRLEKQGIRQPHKLSRQPVTNMTIIDALRQRVDRQVAAGALRDASITSMLQVADQAQKESWSIALIPVELITDKDCLDWFTTA